MNRVILFVVIAVAAIGVCIAESIDEKMRAYGLVDVTEIAPDVSVDLLYATDNNFVGKKMYKDLSRAYLTRKAAQGIKVASEKLAALKPGYRLIITDAARPMSVQRIMFDTVKGTSKARYVSNPAKGGGQHNFGVAVDITIIDESGKELDMGTPVDFLGRKAHTSTEKEMLRSGLLTQKQVANRALLRRVMSAGGFTVLKSEWWHFNFCTRAYARNNLKLLDF